MIDSKEDRRRYETALDKYFEAFKHLTTLDVGVSVVMLAVYREDAFGTTVIFAALVFLTLSFLIALDGMQSALRSIRLEHDCERVLFWLQNTSAALLVGGLASFAISAM